MPWATPPLLRAPHPVVIQKNRVLFGGSGCIPGIFLLQSWLERAWSDGYDPEGCEQLGGTGSLLGSEKWIGATECATLLRYCAISKVAAVYPDALNEVLDVQRRDRVFSFHLGCLGSWQCRCYSCVCKLLQCLRYETTCVLRQGVTRSCVSLLRQKRCSIPTRTRRETDLESSMSSHVSRLLSFWLCALGFRSICFATPLAVAVDRSE